MVQLVGVDGLPYPNSVAGTWQPPEMSQHALTLQFFAALPLRCRHRRELHIVEVGRRPETCPDQELHQ
jgi:hypothetical protein